MDPLAGGYAAFATKDGYDGGGPNNCPVPCIADVERNEQSVPLFYFYRRLARDTGGAGTQRGGLSAEVALTLGGVEEADALIMTHGAEVPNTSRHFRRLPRRDRGPALGRAGGARRRSTEAHRMDDVRAEARPRSA